jgi:renal tumor antigen
MDIWGLGCVYFEILTLFPLFPGDNELDQIGKIHNILGPPTQEVINSFRRYILYNSEIQHKTNTTSQINQD